MSHIPLIKIDVLISSIDDRDSAIRIKECSNHNDHNDLRSSLAEPSLYFVHEIETKKGHIEHILHEVKQKDSASNILILCTKICVNMILFIAQELGMASKSYMWIVMQKQMPPLLDFEFRSDILALTMQDDPIAYDSDEPSDRRM